MCRNNVIVRMEEGIGEDGDDIVEMHGKIRSLEKDGGFHDMNEEKWKLIRNVYHTIL